MKIKKTILLFLLTLSLLVTTIFVVPLSSFTKIVYAENGEYIEHEVIVVCNNIDSLDISEENYTEIGELDGNKIILVKDQALSTNELITLFKDKDGVLNVEPNFIVEEIKDDNQVKEKQLSTGILYEGEKVVDATKYQWSMNNDGHMLNKGKGVDMNYSAWKNQEIDTSLAEVVVAVIDSGVDGSNNDIKMWSDPGNIGLMGTYPGADLHGFDDFGGGSYTFLERNHGTHCAGIIGALWNGEGTSGVSSNVKIMSVKHHDSFASFIKCYEYVLKACEAGVNIRVTSNSWGTGAFHSYILDSFVRTLGEKYNVISVFSAGNSYTDDDTISSSPSVMADNPYAIIVGSCNPDGTKSEFSSYGQTSVDIFAPGTMILSTDFNEGGYEGYEQGYYPEMDSHTILRQDFDSNSIALDNLNNITFNNLDGAYITDELSFDGSNCLYIPSSTLKVSSPNYPKKVTITSDVIDLSSIKDKVSYFGFKLLPLKNGKLDLYFNEFVVPLVDGSAYVGFFDETYSTSANGWAGAYFSLDGIENIDWENFYISINIDLQNDKYERQGDYDVCIDMISFGNDNVPYTYMSGTSMACPAVAGEVAVVCGKYPHLSAKEVVARVLCGTNQKDSYSFEGLCTTGEMANVDKALSDELVPYILKINDLGSGYVRIDGLFMNNLDSVLYRIENTNTFVKATIIEKHFNSLIAKIDENAKGNIDFVLTNTYGKSPLVRAKIDTNPNYKYYDNYDIPIPSEIEELLNTWSGWTAQAYDGNIYFFHQPADDSNNPEVVPTKFIRYNTDDSTWNIIAFDEKLLEQADIETPICYSGTTHDGKLCFIIIGKEKGFEYADKAAIISYDRQGVFKLEKKFADMSAIKDQNFTLVDRNNEFLLVGTAYFHSIMAWNDESKSFESIGPCENRAPNALCFKNDIWVAGGTVAGLANETQSGVTYYKLEKDEEGKEVYVGQERILFEEFVNVNKDQYYGIASIKEGVIAVGQTSKDKTSDTYFIPVYKNGIVGKARSLNIRAYDGPLYKPACATIGNKLYVLAATSNHRHVFSSTTIDFSKPAFDISTNKPYIPVPTFVK